jgi:hypothetical protein
MMEACTKTLEGKKGETLMNGYRKMCTSPNPSSASVCMLINPYSTNTFSFLHYGLIHFYLVVKS